MVPDEEVQIVTAASNKRSRCQKIEYPEDGILKITVHMIGINASQEYTKSQRSTSYTLEYASLILSDVDDNDLSANILPPSIRALDLHKIVINFFSQNAIASIDAISKVGQQRGLIGDGQADFNYCTSGPFFLCQKKRVTLITDPAQQIPVNASSYGVRTSSPSLYSPWSVDVGLLKVYGIPALLPSTCLGLQLKLANIMSNPDELEITCTNLFDFGDSDIISLIKDSDSYSPGTATSVGQFAFYSRLEVWGGSKAPILSYLGKPAVKGISSKAAEGYSVNARNQKVLMSNSATLDTARVSNVQRCLQRKNAIVEVLDSLDPSCFERLLNFDEFECPFESLKVSPKSRKFIQTMSIIFSGSYKNGKQIFPDNYMPFEISDDYNHGISARTKTNWELYFPSALVMFRNKNNIEKSELEGIFKKRKVDTPMSNSYSGLHEEFTGKSSSSASSLSNPRCSVSDVNPLVPLPIFPPEYTVGNDDYDITTDFLDNYYPRSTHTENAVINDTVPVTPGPKIEYECGYGTNRGTAVIELLSGLTEEVDFNVDLTVTESRKFGGKIGTHKWKLSLDYLKGGVALFSAGTYLSVTSIDSKRKIVFTSPLEGDMNIIPRKCYSIGMKYFVQPNESCGTPESLHSDD